MVGKIRPRKVLLPMDFGGSKAKREYKKSGLVISYKEGEIPMENLTYEDFLRASNAYEAQNMLKQLVANNSDSKIAEHWNISYAKLRKIRTELGIRKNKTGKMVGTEEPNEKFWQKLSSKATQEQPAVQKVQEIPTTKQAEEVTTKQVEETPTPQAEEPKHHEGVGFSMSLNGTFTAEQLSDRLEGVCSILTACSNSKFEVTVTVQEKNC